MKSGLIPRPFDSRMRGDTPDVVFRSNVSRLGPTPARTCLDLARVDAPAVGMDPQQIDAILSDLPPPAGISKLEPLKELIRSLRQRRISYVRIAGILRDKCGVTVAPSTVHNFVKTRSRTKSVLTMLPDTSRLPALPQQQPEPPVGTAPRRRFRLDF